jgi:hypothetical protein
MVLIQLTTAPNVVYDVINTKETDVTRIANTIGKEAWAEVHKQSKASQSALAHAFAEVSVDGVYDDALSGELTIMLDRMLRPKRVKFVPAPRVVEVHEEEEATKKPTKPKAPAKPKQPTSPKKPKQPSKADLVREVIKANPKADAAKLIELVIADANIDIPDARVKIYVTENIVKVRG